MKKSANDESVENESNVLENLQENVLENLQENVLENSHENTAQTNDESQNRAIESGVLGRPEKSTNFGGQ